MVILFEKFHYTFDVVRVDDDVTALVVTYVLTLSFYGRYICLRFCFSVFCLLSFSNFLILYIFICSCLFSHYIYLSSLLILISHQLCLHLSHILFIIKIFLDCNRQSTTYSPINIILFFGLLLLTIIFFSRKEYTIHCI